MAILTVDDLSAAYLSVVIVLTACVDLEHDWTVMNGKVAGAHEFASWSGETSSGTWTLAPPLGFGEDAAL